jgi:hypothetical protein
VVVVADEPTDEIPLLAGRGPLDGPHGDGAAAYVCRNLVCERPVTSAAELEAALAR